MAYYIKVKDSVATELGILTNRNKTADGRVLLWQADLDGIKLDTIYERAASVDGVCLTAAEARDEIDGVGQVHLLPSEMAQNQLDSHQLPDMSTSDNQTADTGTNQEGGMV